MRHTSYCLLFALLSLLSFSGHAQTTWNGSIDSDWFNAGNWSSGVPAAGNDAIIPMGFITEINLTGDTDFLFKVDNSGMIFVKLNGHFLTFHDDVLIQNTGLISVENTGTGALVNLADWTNNGAVVVTPCAQFLAQNNSTVTGTGTFANHGIVYKIGSATVVITDGNGIVLTDLNQSPTPDAKCVPTLLVPLDANDQAVLSPSDVDDGSAAPYCAIQDYALSKTNFDCSDVGDNQVMLTVTDKLGNTGSCMTTVTIQDTVPPVITCPASLDIDLNPGECDRVVEFDFLISASDNCGSPALAQTDATGLSSGDAFPIGTTWLMFEASDGTNTDQCTFSVNINEFVPATSGLACHQQINISLGPDCEETLTPAHILSGEYGCFDDFVVTIDETGTNHIDDTFLGQLVTVRVKSLETGNTCWGLGLVEEKLPPQINNCDSVSIVCMQNPAPTIEGGDTPTPNFYDCSGIQLAYYVDEMTSGGCGETYQMMINRIWTFVDNHDNVSSCEQLITIERASLQNQSPQCPPDYSIECSLNSTPDFSPEVTGYPVFSFGGQDVPIKTNQASVCGLTASYSDEVLPKCGAAYRIIRTWLVADWCLPMDGMTNPWTCKQIIDLTDTTPPVVLTPGDLSISPDSDCKAFPILPPAQVSDCSDVTVVTLTPVGPIAGNGGPVPVPGLGIGTHEIIYKATDPCGNFTLDTILVTVEDDLEPYMICIQNTVVGLSNDGVAYSFPESFDNGSYDNCGPIDLVVRRMDAGCFADTSFQDFVRFCCDDIGQTVMVVVRGYDWFGHYSECMVEVQVQDKINPVIQCPPNLTIDCEQDFNDFDLTGEVVNNPNDQTPIDGIAFDNCDMADISFTTTEDINCGQGTVVRTWTATDMGGVEVSCNQIITIVNSSPYDGSGIIWPSDTSMVNCNALTNPAITGEPVVPAGNACSNIVVGHEDEVLQIVQGACLKVLRTWTVIDWCQYDPNVPNSPGRWSWTQTIKVIDDEPPVFESCDDLTFCNFKADCGPLGLDLSVNVTDACTGDDSIDLTWEVDENDDGSVDATGDGQHQGGLYAVGTHRITYHASDG
ncbi:MAG: HYR domain-containing protein, partial [Bacteroidetes bacterium]